MPEISATTLDDADPRFARPDVVGVHEARALLGVSPHEFRQLRKVDPLFPLPTILKVGAVWSGTAMRGYLIEREWLWGSSPAPRGLIRAVAERAHTR